MFRCSANMDTYSDRIKPNTIMDSRITAEQILQFCRILTERTANAHFEIEHSIDRECSQEPPTNNHTSTTDHCERLSADTDDRRQDRLTNSNPTMPSMKPKQAKKDILNKIRNQIFERKRQKLANVQRSISGVWRPW